MGCALGRRTLLLIAGVASLCSVAAPTSFRVVIVQREWNETISEATFRAGPSPRKDSVKVDGTLSVESSQDTNDYFDSLEALKEAYKTKLCGVAFTGELMFLPSVEKHISGFGPRSLPVKASYTAKGPSEINIRYFNPKSTYLDYLRIFCE